MPNLFIDFDGTLIDSRQRQYRLFMELAPQCPLSFDQYWAIKRRRVNQETMLRDHAGVSDAEAIRIFHQQWMQQIELPERLLEDSPLPGGGEFLATTAERFTLYLLTARQQPQQVAAQMGRFGWADYFQELLVTGGSQSKASLIRTVPHSLQDILIGDTGEDIAAAREMGLRSVAVCTGVLSAGILQEYAPDLIVENLTALLHEPSGRALFASATHDD